MANHSLRALTTSAAPPALAVATAVLSHENTDHARRFESIAAEFAAAAGFAAGFATPGRHSESGRSGSERPRSQLHEPRLVASKEVPVLGEIPAASIARIQTSLQKRSCDELVAESSCKSASSELKSKPRTDLGSDLGSKRR